MDNELDLGRYSSAFRRRRLLIAVAVVLGAALGLVVALRAPLGSSASLVPINRAAELASANVDPDDIDVVQVLGQVAAAINADSFGDQLADGSEIDARVIVTADAAVVLLSTSASSETALDRILELALSASAAVYGDEIRTRIEGVTENYTDGLDSRKARLASLEQQASAAGADQTTLVEGLLLAAESARAEISRREDQILAIERLAGRLDDDLRVVETTAPSRSAPAVAMVALGGLGAGLVALGGVALVAAFDRRIRTRRDLDRIGLTNLLGAVAVGSHDLAIVEGAIRQSAIRLGARSIQFVPVTSAGTIPLADHLSSADLPEVWDRPPLDVDAGETIPSSTDAFNIVKVAWGKDTSLKTAAVANQLSAASEFSIGIILVGVPVSELPYIER